MGFPTGTPFTGTPAQIARLESQYTPQSRIPNLPLNSPIWNGEFGPVYADPLVSGEAAASKIERPALRSTRRAARHLRARPHPLVDLDVQGRRAAGDGPHVPLLPLGSVHR